MWDAQVVRDREKVGNPCIRWTRRLPRALGQRGRQKYNCVVQKVTNIHQKREWTWWKWTKHTIMQFMGR